MMRHAHSANSKPFLALILLLGLGLIVGQSAFGFTVSDLAGMGVRRISVGGTLARVAMDAFIKSARAIASEGKFDSFAGVISNPELNKFFADDRKARS